MNFLCPVLILMLAAFAASAQTNAKIDTAATEQTSTFTIGTSYGNTANYYGQTTAEKLPYGSADFSYQSANGLWASAAALKLINTGSGISEVYLSGGYDFDITGKLSGGLSYTRFFFAKNSPLPQSVNPNTASASLIYNWTAVKSGLYGDYVFGNVKDEQGNNLNSFYLTLSNSKLFDLGSLFSKKDYVTIEPSVQFAGGTQVVGHEETATVPAPRGGGLGNAISLPGGKKIRPEKKPLTRQVTTYVESRKFGLVTTSLRLPLAYNRTHYTLEAAYQLSVPNRNFEGIDHSNQSYFTLSFYYLFFKN